MLQDEIQVMIGEEKLVCNTAIQDSGNCAGLLAQNKLFTRTSSSFSHQEGDHRLRHH